MNQEPIIVIVDDDEHVRKATESLVRSVGWKADAYESAERAIASETLPNADFLVTDLQMPGMSGLDLRDHLLRRGVDLPTIVITAFPDEDQRRRAKMAGVLFFLEKPFDGGTLVSSISRALGLAGA
ncbi:response regulator transcription factor [Martelella soudanensis]|uniref:response regulator transcription factor n=1 Tax=unclassified Martelella TaxID=2629616 RepID=UPI0015DF9B8C|nr:MULTISPECIES: response regulator [unclassified Martelella]